MSEPNIADSPTARGDLLDAAEWCNCLAAKKTLTALDISAKESDRRIANHERITLWEAAIILQREATKEKGQRTSVEQEKAKLAEIDEQMDRLLEITEWDKLVGKRLLLTDSITHISRNEWTLLEIAPNGKVAKFKNELHNCKFWTDLESQVLLDVLPSNDGAKARGN